jgi:hypothetical protein
MHTVLTSIDHPNAARVYCNEERLIRIDFEVKELANEVLQASSSQMEKDSFF